MDSRFKTRLLAAMLARILGITKVMQVPMSPPSLGKTSQISLVHLVRNCRSSSCNIRWNCRIFYSNIVAYVEIVVYFIVVYVKIAVYFIVMYVEIAICSIFYSGVRWNCSILKITKFKSTLNDENRDSLLLKWSFPEFLTIPISSSIACSLCPASLLSNLK